MPGRPVKRICIRNKRTHTDTYLIRPTARHGMVKLYTRPLMGMYRISGAKKKKNTKKLIGIRAKAFSIRLTQQEKIIVDVGASVGLLRNQNNKQQLRSKQHWRCEHWLQQCCDTISETATRAIIFLAEYMIYCVGVVFVFVAGAGASGMHLISCRRLTINGSVFTRKCGVYFILLFLRNWQSNANVSNITFSFINFNWFFRMLWHLPHALPAIFN